MEQETQQPWENPEMIEPAIAPRIDEQKEKRPSINDINGGLEILRREDEGSRKEKKPTIH